jgi:hypothetical protein
MISSIVISARKNGCGAPTIPQESARPKPPAKKTPASHGGSRVEVSRGHQH